MKRIFFTLIFSLFLAITPVTAKTLNKIVAIVNDEMISSFQLDKAVVAALAQNPKQNQLTPSQFDQMKVQILNRMVNEKLLEQRTKELDLKVSDPELDSAIEDVQRKNGLTRETLEKALAAQGLTMPEYRDKIKNEILRYKLLSREVNYKVLVTSSEVRDYFDKHIDEYTIEPNSISWSISAVIGSSTVKSLVRCLRLRVTLLVVAIWEN